MPTDAAAAARLRAYSLLEAAQGDAPEDALAELVTLEAEATRHGWGQAAFLAAAGRAVHALVRREPPVAEELVEELVDRAEAVGAPALLGIALSLRAVTAARREDSAALLADAGRAVVLVDDESLPALDRCCALVVSAAAYNTLSLWELVDELYDRATELAPACEVPMMQPAVTVDRVLIRLEWATALLELGEERQALDQLHRTGDAVRLAVVADLPQDLWRLDVLACADLVPFVLAACGEPVEQTLPVDDALDVLDAHRETLVSIDDVEVLPLLDALVGFALLRLGRGAEARARQQPAVPGSSSTGAGSFPAWVRAQVLAEPDGTAGSCDAVHAHREYGVLVSHARWAARRAVLAAARATIATERRGAEHAVLARDVLLDPLTGLSNRRVFDDWREEAPESARATAMLLIDLDAFKVVNDLHGHAVGDEALRRVARVVAGHVRPGDLALRLGGDEFAVILTDEHDPALPDGLAQLRSTAEARARVLRAAVVATDWERIAPGLAVRLSIGVAVGVLGPHERGAADRLYREADVALYDDKAVRDSEDDDLTG
jgi:diguanylate cyclase (GGDEF)-like protein